MYFLSLYAIFKNESHIMKEWILHYLEEGVEHFYLIDNGSTDNYKEIIEPYKDIITLFEDDKKHAQIELYNKHILPVIHETKWIIGCDLDEFIWGVDTSIANILHQIENTDHENKVGLIQIPWEMYGSSGHIEQPRLVVPNFKNRLKYSEKIFINCKSIAKTSAVKKLYVHYFELKDDYIILDSTLEPTFLGQNHDLTEEIINKSKIRCAHYAIQSYNWFKDVKMKRGDVNWDQYENVRNDEYFKQYDYNEIYDDKLYQKNKLLYDNLIKEDTKMEIKEDFVAPWTPNNEFYHQTKKINVYTLFLTIFILLIIFLLIFKIWN